MKIIQRILNDKSFIKKTFAITVPVALQNLLSNVLNMIDTIMIGQLGDDFVGAVGLANKVFFVFSLLMFGICSGSAILASQYYGNRDLLGIKRVLKMSLMIGVGGSFVFVLSGIFFPEQVMSILTIHQNQVEIGAIYLGIIAFSYPLIAVTNCFVAILRSMNYVKLPVIITSISIVINVILNYVFIFGHFGMPAMGVAGSALATLIARIIEVILLLIAVYRHKVGDGGVGDFIHQKYTKENGVPFLNKPFVYKYFYTAAPVIANEFMWGLGVTMYSLVYGRMPAEATNAITITSTVEQLAMVFFFGICHAAAVVLGNELGANELEKAEEHAKNYMVMMFGLSIIGAILAFLLKDAIISLYPVSEVVADYVRLSLTVFAIYMPVRMLNALIIVAILRSGGDTKAALFLDVTGVWFIGIPMAVIGGLFLHLPIYLVYAMILIEEVYKAILGYHRYRKKKWLRNIVEI
jgi:putative MATE family efflux protein